MGENIKNSGPGILSLHEHNIQDDILSSSHEYTVASIFFKRSKCKCSCMKSDFLKSELYNLSLCIYICASIFVRNYVFYLLEVKKIS